MTCDSTEVSNGIMSSCAQLKLQLGHLGKLEFSMPRKNNYVGLIIVKIN
jgi:hypothetical protein